MLRLTVVSGARAGAWADLKKPVIRIGRAPDNDLVLDPTSDLDASGHHAEIRADHGRWVLVDLQSRNGVFLPARGNHRVFHHALSHGDHFQLGTQGPVIRAELFGPPPTHSAVEVVAVAPQLTPNVPVQAQHAPVTAGLPAAPFPAPQGAPVAAAVPAGAGPNPNLPRIGDPGGLKMGQQTLLAHVGAMMNQRRGKSTIEIRALVDSNVRKATGPLRTIIFVLLGMVALSGVAIVVIAMRPTTDPETLRKELEKLGMDDPRRKDVEKKLGTLVGNDSNVGRTIYDSNKDAVFMLVAHHGKSFDKGGFCTAFAIQPRLLASNAHCVQGALGYEQKGADIWAHLNESAKGSAPKMFRVKSQMGHPKYRQTASTITPDVGLFVLEEDDAPRTVKLASRDELKQLGTGDPLYVIGFPGRTMDEASPVATFMASHVGRITDSAGQKASFAEGWLIQHEGQTTPGTSGSPIFNSAGKVVAINAGGLLEANKQAVYKYAMRIDLIEDIKTTGASAKKKAAPKPDDDDRRGSKAPADDDEEEE